MLNNVDTLYNQMIYMETIVDGAPLDTKFNDMGKTGFIF